MSKFKPNHTIARAPRPAPRPALSTSIVASPGGSTDTVPERLVPVFEAEFNPARQFAFKCSLLFLFFRFSFLHEFISFTLHIDTHILIILGAVSYLAWVIAGGMFTAFKDRLGLIWLAFVGWLCLATLFSTWRGGSFQMMVPYLRTVFPLLLLLPAVVLTPGDLRKTMNVIGIAGTTTVLFGLVHRKFNEGRIEVASGNGSIQDPNDFAAHLLFVLPAIAYLMFAKERSIFVKIFGVGIIGAALLESMSTGSRGGFVALLATAVFVAITGSAKLRLGVVVGLPLLGLLALPFVPEQSVKRLSSLVDSNDATKSARESEEARRALLTDSLRLTARHPLLGVGPGQFMTNQAGLAAEVHQKGIWHETHNGYTQISSECGIPALILYVTAVVLTFKSLRRASKANLPHIPEIARTLLVMGVGFSAALFFLSQGYRFSMLVISAMAISINQVIARSERVSAVGS